MVDIAGGSVRASQGAHPGRGNANRGGTAGWKTTRAWVATGLAHTRARGADLPVGSAIRSRVALNAASACARGLTGATAGRSADVSCGADTAKTFDVGVRLASARCRLADAGAAGARGDDALQVIHPFNAIMSG
jgi:hypothetical protein